jgi:hypothetical protein
MIRLAVTLHLFAPVLADACPPWARYSPPGPVVYYQSWPPPSYPGPCSCWHGYPPVRFIQIVEAKPTEIPRVVVNDGAPDGWCHIKGRIVWDKATRPVPVRTPIKATKDQNVAHMDSEFFTEDWVVHPSNYGIRNVVIWLAPEPQGDDVVALEKARKENKSFKFPSFKTEDIYPPLRKLTEPIVEIEIPCCRFIPHVVAARAGQNLVFNNTSPVPHNSKWVSRENGEMSPLVPPDRQKVIENLKAERFPIEVSCSIHPWMKCWVRVFDHPYFAVTDDNGKFEIKFVPTGKLRLFIWQENGMHRGTPGRFGQTIDLKSGTLDLKEIKFDTGK